MASDIQRYGTGELAGDYYFVNEYPSAVGKYAEQQAAVYFIDDLGGAHKVGTGTGGWTPEEIAELPSRQEAISQHLVPAFEKAERNRKAWLKAQEGKPKPEPAPPPVSPATARFFDDGGF